MLTPSSPRPSPSVVVSPSPEPSVPPNPSPSPSPVVASGGCKETGGQAGIFFVSEGDGGCTYINRRTNQGTVWLSPEVGRTHGIGVEGTFTWHEANSRCQNLFAGGRGDWRLPTRTEGFEISTDENNGEEIFRDYFHWVGDKDFPYWTNEFIAPDRATYVSIRSGRANTQYVNPEDPRNGQNTGGNAYPRIMCVSRLRPIPKPPLSPEP